MKYVYGVHYARQSDEHTPHARECVPYSGRNPLDHSLPFHLDGRNEPFGADVVTGLAAQAALRG